MNLFPYILGPVWVLDVTLTSDGHTIAAWRCKMGGEPQQTVYDAAAVAKGVAVVTVSGHGTIVKPADSQLAARVRDDRATFLWSEHDGRIAFVRRERLQGMLTELSEAGIHPQRIEVSAPPDTAAGELLAGLGWRQLLRPTAEGSSLAQAVVRRAALPVLGLFLCLLAANAAVAPSLNTRRQTLQKELSARERTASTAADATDRQRTLLAEFSARPAASRAVVCDRIAEAVPAQVVLTRLAVEPLTKRFEAGEALAAAGADGCRRGHGSGGGRRLDLRRAPRGGGVLPHGTTDERRTGTRCRTARVPHRDRTMNLPYRYRGLSLVGLLALLLPWAAWHFALSDTFGAWRECGRLERRLDALAPTTPATGAAVPAAVEAPELILSGGLLDSVRRFAPAGVHTTGYVPAVTLRQDGIEIHTAQLTLTGPFAELLRTVETLERRLPACRLRSAEWQTATRPRTRRTQLTLMLYIQQLTLITESK